MTHRDNGEDDIVLDGEAEDRPMKGKSEKKLRDELKQAQKEAREYLAGWQRVKADLINFKRESEEARKQFATFANEGLLLQMLPVLDSFEEALKHTNDGGVEQIYRQLLSVLEANGIARVSPEGEEFDPSKHESVATVSVENKKDGNTIVEVVQKGYTLHGKVIRPARVRVGEWKHKS